MTLDDLMTLRKEAGLTQADFARRLGLSLRAYQDIETGKATLRPLHILAAERAALDLAIEHGNPMLAPPSVRRQGLALAKMILG